MMACETCPKCGAYMEESHCGFIVGHPVGSVTCLSAQLAASRAEASRLRAELSRYREAFGAYSCGDITVKWNPDGFWAYSRASMESPAKLLGGPLESAVDAVLAALAPAAEPEREGE